jgi:hypothetical protein
MSETWKKRQRATQDLVGSIADHLLRKPRITARQLYGLCQLTWITNDFNREDAGYIYSTKLPGLKNIFGDAVPVNDLDAAARVVAAELKKPTALAIVKKHTGITNYRNAYRNTSLLWLDEHREKVVRILRRGRKLSSDSDGAKLAVEIAKLPGIPRTAGVQSSLRKPEGLLTPLIFAVDPRHRFPIINGNPGVLKLLQQEGGSGASLEQQHDTMVAMIGRNGIRNAADLDLYSQELPEIRAGRAKPLTKQPTTGRLLKQKDDSDIEVIGQSSSQARKRLHNSLTNSVLAMYQDDFKLTEGGGAAMYDIDVDKFDGRNHLLIEAKSSVAEAEVRMAIGQLYAYGFHLRRSSEDRMAVLLPEEPNELIKRLLDSLEIGLVWMCGPRLSTKTEWLMAFAATGRAQTGGGD